MSPNFDGEITVRTSITADVTWDFDSTNSSTWLNWSTLLMAAVLGNRITVILPPLEEHCLEQNYVYPPECGACPDITYYGRIHVHGDIDIRVNVPCRQCAQWTVVVRRTPDVGGIDTITGGCSSRRVHVDYTLEWIPWNYEIMNIEIATDPKLVTWVHIKLLDKVSLRRHPGTHDEMTRE